MKLAKHNIEVQDARPLRQPPYRLPHAFRELVQKEMQRSGVIEPYTSEWASSIVLVRKKGWDNAFLCWLSWSCSHGCSSDALGRWVDWSHWWSQVYNDTGPSPMILAGANGWKSTTTDCFHNTLERFQFRWCHLTELTSVPLKHWVDL